MLFQERSELFSHGDEIYDKTPLPYRLLRAYKFALCRYLNALTESVRSEDLPHVVKERWQNYAAIYEE